MKEGFWKTKENPEFPLPIPSLDKSWRKRKERFLRDLQNVEPFAIHRGYKGSHKCRLCGKKAGSYDFSFRSWTWPEGFSHYIEEHNVKPTPAFIDFIEILADVLHIQKWIGKVFGQSETTGGRSRIV